MPVNGVRKAIAAAMTSSAFTAPHVTEWLAVDVTETMGLVRSLRADPLWSDVRVNPMLFVAKALLIAASRYPGVNARWGGKANQEIVYHNDVNLGIAAATPRGLVVPNIKNADELTLPELAGAQHNWSTRHGQVRRRPRTCPAAPSPSPTSALSA